MEDRTNIERVLLGSLLKGTAIGIKLRDTSVLIVTAVINIDEHEDHTKWIEIKPNTLYGYPIKETVIQLKQIESAIPFSVHYDDPLYVKLREVKAKILGII